MCSFARPEVEGKRVFFSARNQGSSSTNGADQICYSAAILAEYLRRQQARKQVIKYWYLRVFPASQFLEIYVSRSINIFSGPGHEYLCLI